LQILGLLIGVFGPFLGIPKEWVTADDRTVIHFNEKTTLKVQVAGTDVKNIFAEKFVPHRRDLVLVGDTQVG
jgi:hypothetical protein